MRENKPVRAEILQMAKENCPLIFDGVDAATAYLSDANPKKRKIAIYICDKHYGLSSDADFILRCEQIATADSDSSVRVTGINALARKFSGTTDYRISGVLARVVIRSQSAPLEQMAAYLALQEVHSGRTSESELQHLHLALRATDELSSKGRMRRYGQIAQQEGLVTVEQWESAGKIDWAFVNQFVSKVND